MKCRLSYSITHLFSSLILLLYYMCVCMYVCMYVYYSVFCSHSLRLLVRKARKLAVQYGFAYHEPIPVTQLVQKVAAVMQEYTQSG